MIIVSGRVRRGIVLDLIRSRGEEKGMGKDSRGDYDASGAKEVMLGHTVFILFLRGF